MGRDFGVCSPEGWSWRPVGEGTVGSSCLQPVTIHLSTQTGVPTHYVSISLIFQAEVD